MTEHDHRCSDACAASEPHMRAMELDADQQIAEADKHPFEASDPDEDDAAADTCRQCGVLQGDHR